MPLIYDNENVTTDDLSGEMAPPEKNLEELLHDPAKLYGMVVESSQDAIFLIDQSLTVRYLNKGAARLFRSSVEKIVGKTVDHLFPVPMVERQIENLHKIFKQCKPFYFEGHVQFPHGLEWLGTWLTPLKDPEGRVTAVLGVSRDITRRKEAELRLRDSEALHRMVVELSPDGIVFVDIKAEGVESNPSGARMLGYESPEEMQSLLKSGFEMLPGENHEAAGRVIRKVIEKGSIPVSEAVMVKKDGTRFPVEFTASLIEDREGAPLRIVTIFRDISNRRQAEEELEKRHQDLARANKILANLHRTKDEFIHMVSHELRTPLVTGMGYVELLLNGYLGPVTERMNSGMETARRNLKRLTTLLDEILEYHNLLERTHISGIECASTDLADLCQESSMDFLMRSGRSKEVLTTIFPEGLPTVWADKNRIRQVFSNLLDNAIRHGGENVHITFSLELVGSKSVKAIIKDNGVGISEEFKARVFEPFMKSTETDQGSGLGLAIVQRILEAHESRLELESCLGQGTTVSFILPAASPDSPPSKESSRHTEKMLKGAQERVLIVEDDEDSLAFLSLALSDQNYLIEHARSAEAALEILTEGPVDLVLVALSLPGASSAELCRHMKNTNNIPICILTAHAEENDRRLSTDAGCDAFLLKPVPINDLLQTMRNLLKPD